MADKRKTAARGYGGRHQATRKRLLAALVEGTPCPYCGAGMFLAQQLDVDHATPAALGGDGSDSRLAHSSCNRRAGAKLKAALSVRTTARSWPSWWSGDRSGGCWCGDRCIIHVPVEEI